MSSGNIPGRSLLMTLLGWWALLMISGVVIQVLVAELVRWVTVLAPWLLLTCLGVAVAIVAIRVMRHRFFY